MGSGSHRDHPAPATASRSPAQIHILVVELETLVEALQRPERFASKDHERSVDLWDLTSIARDGFRRLTEGPEPLCASGANCGPRNLEGRRGERSQVRCRAVARVQQARHNASGQLGGRAHDASRPWLENRVRIEEDQPIGAVSDKPCAEVRGSSEADVPIHGDVSDSATELVRDFVNSLPHQILVGVVNHDHWSVEGEAAQTLADEGGGPVRDDHCPDGRAARRGALGVRLRHCMAG